MSENVHVRFLMSTGLQLDFYMYEAKAMLHVVVGVAVVMTMMMLSDVTGRCPATCFCQQSSRTVYCSRRGLDAVPDTVPPGTRQLHLNGNHFKSSVIRRANFSRFPDVVFEVSESVLSKISCIQELFVVLADISECYICEIKLPEARFFSQY